MSLNKLDIINQLNRLNLPKDKYWLMAGTAMVIYSIRELTHDIDIGCTSEVIDELEKIYGSKLLSDGTRKVLIDGYIEIYENWLYDSVIIYDDLPVVTIKGLIELKTHLNREKDIRDLKLIEEYLKNKEK